MRARLKELRKIWWYMLEVPWHHSGEDTDGEHFSHWFSWITGWAWAIAGLVLGALVAPSLLRWAGLSNTRYQDWLVIGIAVLAGILVQLLGWCLMLIAGSLLIVTRADKVVGGLFGGSAQKDEDENWLSFILSVVVFMVFTGIAMAAFFLPFAGVGYGIYRYLTWVGAGQRTVTVAFVGGLLVKTLLIPFIKSIVTGAAIKFLIRILRGGNAKAKSA